MEIPGFRFYRRTEPLHTRANQELSGEVHEQIPDGRLGTKRNVYFTEPFENPSFYRLPGSDITRFSYLVIEEERALLLGMYVSHRLRRSGLGGKLLRFFEEHAEAEGLRVVGTARIHKPVLAVALQAAGYIPKSRELEAEVFDPLATDAHAPPLVRFVDEVRAAGHPGIQASTDLGTPFYTLAPPDFKPGEPGKVVALHTGYWPPARAQPQALREAA